MNAKEAVEMFTEINEIIELVKTLRPSVYSFGREIKPIIESFTDSVVDMNARAIRRYETVHGFTREEAILLTLDVRTSLYKSLEKTDNSKKKS
jgi:hypothetical protein